jgi:DNA-binding transcriptional ArsR family regulator
VSVVTKTYEAAGELLRVLAAPARLAILVELGLRPCHVHQLVERLEMSQPLVSQHLRIDHHVAHIVADAVNHAKEIP